MYEFTYVETLAYTLMTFGKLWPKVVEKEQKDVEMDVKCHVISKSSCSDLAILSLISLCVLSRYLSSALERLSLGPTDQ